MNLRQWARATQKRIADQPAELRHPELSAADIETILRQGIHALAESLMHGDDLRLRDLGRFWIEEKSPRQMVSNLPDQKRSYELDQKRTLRFRASARLIRLVRNGHAIQTVAQAGLDEVHRF